MKFYQGFLWLLGISAGLIFTAMNWFIGTVANAALLIAGVAILALDVFAFLVWFVNWKYYPEE